MNRTFKISPALVLVLSFVDVCPAPPPGTPAARIEEIRELRREFGRLHGGKEWDKAIEVGQKLVKLAPAESVHSYNLACVHALANHADEAVHWLVESAAEGFEDLRLLATDTDLDAIRTHADYKKAVRVVTRNHDKAITALKLLYEKSPTYIVEPPNHDKNRPVPLVVALHGYGGSGQGIAGAWRKAAARAGALLVVPQGVHPHPGPQIGYSWTGANRGGADEAEYLVRWTVERVLRDYKIDMNRMILTGFSQGGYVSQTVGARQPYAFTGVIPMAGGYNPASGGPAKATGDHPPRFYFMVGANDRSVDQVRQASVDFAKAGYKTELRVYPKAGHSFPFNTDTELKRALDFVLAR